MSAQINLQDADYHIPAKDMVVILQALAEGPYKLVQPAIQNLERQIQAQLGAPPAKPDSFRLADDAPTESDASK